MTSAREERSTTERHLEKARAGLRDMNELMAERPERGAEEAGALYGNLVTVMNELDAALRLMAPEGKIARVACPSCRRMTVPLAARCGFCWKKMGTL